MDLQTAQRLAELRRAHGLSQEQLARELGLSRQAVSKWERAESSPDTDNLIALARLYRMSLDELVGLAPATPCEGPTAHDGEPADTGPKPRRRWRAFPYPVVPALAYFAIGELWSWSYAWLVFLTVPLYYWVAGLLDEAGDERKDA